MLRFSIKLESWISDSWYKLLPIVYYYWATQQLPDACLPFNNFKEQQQQQQQQKKNSSTYPWVLWEIVAI